jgi:hypothetical protein
MGRLIRLWNITIISVEIIWKSEGWFLKVSNLMNEIVIDSSERSGDAAQKERPEVAARRSNEGGRETCQLILQNSEIVCFLFVK